LVPEKVTLEDLLVVAEQPALENQTVSLVRIDTLLCSFSTWPAWLLTEVLPKSQTSVTTTEALYDLIK